MRVSIFARLIFSYLMLFGIFAGVSLYFIFHIDQFNKVIRSIILNDTLILEYSNRLSDALLSESRNDRKFVVLKDEVLYENSRKAGLDFNKILNDALSKTNSVEIKQFFSTIRSEHQHFMQLVNDEREILRLPKPHLPDWYAEEKRKSADDIIDQLKKIKQLSEKTALNKIVNLNASGDKAKSVSILISVFAVSIGLIVAFVITQSIKKPLDMIMAKTVDISKENFKGDLVVKSPPEIVELAAALNTMCHKLQKVNDIKSDFFAHMSHELRTPLSSIKVGTEMLLEGLGGELTKKQQHILSIVTKESNRLIELVNSLLDLSKMEAGMLKYQFYPTLLFQLVNKTLETLAPLVEAKNLSIDNKIGELHLVNVDQERILLVLRNIIGNAIKFSPKDGTIKIEARLKKNVVEVSVHDTGPGIAKKDLERIFLKFQQVISAKEPSMRGTGLGLATVKQVILAHGGKVWATSQMGQGSTLHITLPLAA